MKKISIILSILASIAVTSTISVKVQAKDSSSQKIPKAILEEIEQKVEDNKNEIEEIKAWETDLNGNVKEVVKNHRMMDIDMFLMGIYHQPPKKIGILKI